MMIKGWEIGKNSYLLYFLYSNVDEALYGIVWYGPLMVVMFTLLSIKMWCDNILEGKLDYECVLVMIIQCEVSCLVSYSSCDLGCMTIV